MKIYTKTGDTGETSLMGGDRVSKSSPRIEAYGTVDELNACIGLALTACNLSSLTAHLTATQQELFVLGADLATPRNKNAKIDRITDAEVMRLEQAIDALEEELPPIRYFILPGGSELAARLHVCRTVCRRAERLTVELAKLEEITQNDILYLNRLSDYLFVASRYANFSEGIDDIPWKTQHT